MMLKDIKLCIKIKKNLWNIIINKTKNMDIKRRQPGTISIYNFYNH